MTAIENDVFLGYEIAFSLDSEIVFSLGLEIFVCVDYETVFLDSGSASLAMLLALV